MPVPQFLQSPRFIYGCYGTWTRDYPVTGSTYFSTDQVVFGKYVGEFSEPTNMGKRAAPQQHGFADNAGVSPNEIGQHQAVDYVGIELQALEGRAEGCFPFANDWIGNQADPRIIEFCGDCGQIVLIYANIRVRNQ
jgi:hypothetical protein